MTWWCTVLTEAVHIGHAGDSPFSSFLSRVQVGTVLGVTVPSNTVAVPPRQHAVLGHPTGGGAPDMGWHCPRGSTPSQVSPPSLHLFHYLCKCANTPSVSPSHASVLAFSQLVFKGYSLLVDKSSPLNSTTIYPKYDHTLYSVLITENKMALWISPLP